MNKVSVVATTLMLGAAGIVSAQGAPATRPADSRIERLEQRMNEMEKRHEAELKERDAEIEQLKSQLNSKPTVVPSTMTPPVSSQPAAPDTGTADIDKSTQDMLQDIEKKEAPPPVIRLPASFNPDFAVIGDFAGNASDYNRNPARNKFDLREVELDLRAAVDPRAEAVVILPIDREVADPLFFNPKFADGHVDTSIDIEEAYLHIHDFGVPNLTANVGRFHLHFGRWNLLHLHAWPTVDNAFTVQNFLGPESLVDSGVSFDYLVPPQYVGGEAIEAFAEIITGMGSSDDPVLNNDAFVNTPGINTHLLWNHDITPNWNFELGGSFLYGHHNDAANEYANLSGVDFTLMHTDPLGRYNNQVFQFEGIYGNTDTSVHHTQHSFGGFLLAQQQLNADWYAGARLDWTKNALNEHQEVWDVAPYVTWYWSEFLRFRLEYQHKQGHTPTENNVWFQVDFVFGAHPPHPYWSSLH